MIINSDVNWIEKQCKINNNADKKVLYFIYQFTYTQNNSYEILTKQFKFGYCYYFALILKNAFNRGELCWIPYEEHIVWKDDEKHNSILYDITGIFKSNENPAIPISYLGEGINEFKHIPGYNGYTSDSDIENIIKKYNDDLKGI